jgi:hypothetical protein
LTRWTFTRKPTPALGVAMLALLIALGGTAAAGQLRDAGYSQGIEGAWRITVTQAGPGAAPPFEGLLAFSDGGTLVEVNQRNQSTAVGAWEKIDEHHYHWTFTRFRFNASGTFTGTVTAVEDDTLDQAKDAFDGVSTVEFRDAAGNVIGGGPATVHGTRIDP